VVDIDQRMDLSSYSSDGENALDGLSYEELAELRKELVGEYSMLEFYPNDYELFQGDHKKIYGRIEEYQSWLSPAAYFFTNPYLLIISTAAPHINPVNLACPEVSIVYDHGVIEEIHQGESATCWFDQLYRSTKKPGTLWLFMVNAWDAGFHYAHVDLNQSSNVVASEDPDHITNGVHSRSYYYHVGQYGVNNISPRDTRAWLSLQQRDVRTEVYVKLWRARPESVKQDADIVYRIVIDPE